MPKLPLLHRLRPAAQAPAEPEKATSAVGHDAKPSPVLREVGAMIDFALRNPDRSQVPLTHRAAITQAQWDAMTDAERTAVRDQIDDAHFDRE